MKCSFTELNRDGITVVIKDNDIGMSVTNDAEAVLDFYKEKGVVFVICEDSYGDYTKMYYGETNTWMGKGIGVVFEGL
jgi:hypothetical protein